MFKKIKTVWNDIPGKWLLLVLGMCYLIFISTGGRLDSFPPTVGLLFVLPVLNTLAILYVMYLFVAVMKARLQIPYILSVVVFFVMEWLLFRSFAYGFDISLWEEFNYALLYAVLAVGVTGYLIHSNRYVNGILFVTVLLTSLWVTPAGKGFLEIVFTNRTLWENKHITVRVSEDKTLDLSIPRRYFERGWFFHRDDFYHLEFSYPDLSPAFGNEQLKRKLTVYLFANSLDLGDKLYLYKPKDFSGWKNTVTYNGLEYRKKHPSSLFIAQDKKNYPLYFQCGEQVGTETLEDVFYGKYPPLCTRNPLYATGFQYRYWLTGKDLLTWQALEDKVRRKLETFIVSKE